MSYDISRESADRFGSATARPGFSYALYDYPGLVQTILDRYTDWTAQVVARLPEVGVDFVWSLDDMAYKTGPMFSPQVRRSSCWH